MIVRAPSTAPLHRVAEVRSEDQDYVLERVLFQVSSAPLRSG